VLPFAPVLIDIAGKGPLGSMLEGSRYYMFEICPLAVGPIGVSWQGTPKELRA
jgi:hypothetical protein